RNLERQALLGGPRNGLCLAPLLRLHAGKGAWSIDESHDRNAELVGQPHEPDRLAIALGLGHSEIVLEARGSVLALFMPDEHHWAAIDARQTADDRRIVRERAIPRQRDKIVGNARD